MNRVPVKIPVNTGRVSPQAKILQVNQRLGNTGIANMQGTTRTLYDSILLNGNKTIEFFKQPNVALNTLTNSFAGTNVDAQNGLLGVGESMIVKRISFSVFENTAIAPGTIIKYTDPAGATALAGFNQGFYAGVFTLKISNQVVAKPISNQVFLPAFNSSPGATAGLVVYDLLTDLSIPPILPFIVQLDIPAYTASLVQFIRCTIEGEGAILNTGVNY